ncbi:MAG: 50S ribosomal protein L29 [Akkermansiaceae bacterium]|nr:50S ribosomal protein L29 [Akkermansiaceae bacterium]MCF7730903.1 50S ribosomal protein L29 [Akkermansiaceae bacterium]
MAKTKETNLREASVDELAAQLRELKQEALHLRLQQATGQLENSARIRIVRRQIARTLTAASARKRA